MGARRLGKFVVETSNEDKVLFPDDGFTKADLMDYYERIAEYMLPHLRGRPISMQRFPDGVQRDGFFQKDTPDYFPDWIERIEVRKEDGSKNQQVLCESKATLVYLANQACITPHTWLSRREALHTPDRLVFDLDPPNGEFNQVRNAARLVSDALEERGLAVFLQITGSRGIHVVSPLKPKADFDSVRKLARDIAAELSEEHPEELTTEQRKNKRGNRIYLDTARNAYAQTMVAPYSIRPLHGAPVATPIDPDELADHKLTPRRYTIKSIFRRLAQREDPWAGIQRSARSLPD